MMFTWQAFKDLNICGSKNRIDRFGITDDWSSWNVPIMYFYFSGQPSIEPEPCEHGCFKSNPARCSYLTWIRWNLQDISGTVSLFFESRHASLRIWCGCWPILFIFEHISMHPWIHTDRTCSLCLDHHGLLGQHVVRRCGLVKRHPFELYVYPF